MVIFPQSSQKWAETQKILFSYVLYLLFVLEVRVVNLKKLEK